MRRNSTSRELLLVIPDRGLHSRSIWRRSRSYLPPLPLPSPPPPCTTSQSFGPTDFPGYSWNGSASFKLLGAAIGLVEWRESFSGQRMAKAGALLVAIGRFPDVQGATCLLRSCTGAEVLYSCRTVPPGVHSAYPIFVRASSATQRQTATGV